jgi:hypothetical protein
MKATRHITSTSACNDIQLDDLFPQEMHMPSLAMQLVVLTCNNIMNAALAVPLSAASTL